MLSLYVAKLSENATLPQRGSAGAAGFDLASAVSGTLMPRQRAVFPTDLAVGLPEGTYGRIAPRSGLALRNGIDVLAGVVDSDYRGNVGVILYNTSDFVFEVKVGDRIAQLILEKYQVAQVVPVSEIGQTERGAGGFGSTGV